jgi:hypothetical protein
LTEVIKKCLAEERALIVRMLQGMTGINRQTVRKISQDLKNEELCTPFVLHPLTSDPEHQRSSSSVEFVEMSG